MRHPVWTSPVHLKDASAEFVISPEEREDVPYPRSRIRRTSPTSTDSKGSFAAVISASADITAVEVIALVFQLKCPMPGCSFQLQGATKEELLTKGMDHVKTHGMAALSPDMMAKVQAAIKQT